jgi:hypothetical protein
MTEASYEGGDELVKSESRAAPSETAIQGLPMFQENHDIFEPLTLREKISTIDDDGTPLDVISMAISYDSKYLLALC